MRIAHIEAFPLRASDGARQGRPVARMGLLGLVVARILLWRRRVRERALIAAFDDRTLHDIGLTRLDAVRRYVKPF